MDTVTAAHFFGLLMRMGTERSFIEGDTLRCVGRAGKKEIAIAEAKVEVLFAWSDTPSIAWKLQRLPMPSNMPIPTTEDQASELAFGAARALGAFSVYVDNQADITVFCAITSFRRTSSESARARDKAARAFVARQLSRSAEWLIEAFVRWGTAGAREYSTHVADVASLVRAAGSVYVEDLPLSSELAELATRLDGWSLRAAIPNEALGVATQIDVESKRFASPASTE